MEQQSVFQQGGHWGDSGWIHHKLVLKVDWQKN